MKAFDYVKADMAKRVVAWAVIIAMILCMDMVLPLSMNGSATAGSVYGATSKSASAQSASATAKAAENTVFAVDATSYDMDLKLNTKKDTLTQKVTINFKNNTGKTLKEICIRDMNPAVHKFNKANTPEDNKGKDSKIKSIRLKGSKKNLKLKYKKGKTVIYVKLGKKGAVKPGKTGSVVVRMKTDVPVRADRYGLQKTKNGKIYALSFCFPYLADNPAGTWITDPFFDDGESRSFDLANYKVTFSAPKSYTVVATGSSTTKGGKTTIKAGKVRDFAIYACDFVGKDSFTVKGIKVNNFWLKGAKRLKNYRKLCKLVAQDSIKAYIQKIGKCPHEEIDMVPCLFGFGFGGMEYPGLIMVNAQSTYKGNVPDYVGLYEVVCHEIGHQWFYSAVGNREYKEAWIDEGFTTYLEKDLFSTINTPSLKFLNKIDEYAFTPEDSFRVIEESLESARQEHKGMKLNISPDKYPKGRWYGDAEYFGGFCFLEEVKKQLGEKKFDKFLREVYKTYYNKQATTKGILKIIRKYDNSKEMEEIISFWFK